MAQEIGDEIRGLLVAVVVLAVLGGALYWSNRKQKADAAKPAADAATKILTIPEDQIKEVTPEEDRSRTHRAAQGRRRQVADHRAEAAARGSGCR